MPVFVLDSCICCSACIPIAPDHFDFTDDGDRVRCVRQPATPSEWNDVEDAREVCPVDAIQIEMDPDRSK